VSTIHVTDRDREQLEEIDSFIGRLGEALTESAREIDREQAARWAETVKRWALRLQANPPASLDEAAVAKLRRIILEGMEAESRLVAPLDVLDELLVRSEAIRHVLRDALDADVGVPEWDAQALLGRVLDWVPVATRKDLARLSGRSSRQVQRWLRDGGESTYELRLAARLIAILRRSWTPEGVLAWFNRPRKEFGQQAPIDMLGDPMFQNDLLEAARRGRAQQA
jgi:hypothetical protein